jgi:predicted ATPase
MLRGTAIAYQDQPEDGIAELSAGLTELEATGTRLAAPYFRARLAEAYLLAGRREEGLGAVEETLSHVDQGWWLPEQHRIRAELLLLAPGAETEAESALRQALEAASSQGAKVLELRAMTSLARLQSQQGHAGDGLEKLARCYAAFTEGFDLPDLQEAKALVDELQLQPSLYALDPTAG